MVERPTMAPWVVGSIPHGGLAELFLVPASVAQPVYHQILWYVLLCLWDGAYKRNLVNLLVEKSSPCNGGSRFPLSLSGSLTYV